MSPALSDIDWGAQVALAQSQGLDSAGSGLVETLTAVKKTKLN